MYHYCISQTWSKSYVLAFILTKYKKNLANTSLLIESQHIKTVIWSKIYSDWKAQTWNHRRTQVTEMPTKCMYAILIDSCKEEKKRRPTIWHLIKIQRRCWWGVKHFTPMRTFHPFVWHPLWSKTICCYCLMQTHKTGKIVKLTKVSFEICILIQRSLLLCDFDLFVLIDA